MNRKHLLYFVTILAFVVIVIIIISDPESTVSYQGSEIAISNTDLIKKIRLSGREDTMIFKRLENTWSVNSFSANQREVRQLIDVLGMLQVESPVSKIDQKRIEYIMDSAAIDVHMEIGARKENAFQVLPDTASQKVYFRSKKRADIFSLRVPYQHIDLHEVFTPSLNRYKSRFVFLMEPQDIDEVTLDYPEKAASSFKIVNYHDGSFSLSELHSGNFISNFDAGKVMQYLSYFQAVYYESTISDDRSEIKTKLMSQTPFIHMKVKTIDGSITDLKVYKKYDPEQQEKVDVFKAYGVINGSEIVVIQYYVFDPIFKEINYFRT